MAVAVEKELVVIQVRLVLMHQHPSVALRRENIDKKRPVNRMLQSTKPACMSLLSNQTPFYNDDLTTRERKKRLKPFQLCFIYFLVPYSFTDIATKLCPTKTHTSFTHIHNITFYYYLELFSALSE